MIPSRVAGRRNDPYLLQLDWDVDLGEVGWMLPLQAPWSMRPVVVPLRPHQWQMLMTVSRQPGYHNGSRNALSMRRGRKKVVVGILVSEWQRYRWMYRIVFLEVYVHHGRRKLFFVPCRVRDWDCCSLHLRLEPEHVGHLVGGISCIFFILDISIQCWWIGLKKKKKKDR